MTTIQSYDNLTVSKTVTPTVTATPARVIDTTAPLVQGVQNFTKGLQNYNHEVDKAFSDEAYFQFQKERNKLLHDPDNGFFTNKGKNAYNNKDKAIKAYSDLVAKYATEMRGEYGDVLRTKLEQNKLQDLDLIDRHTATEFSKYKIDTTAANISSSLETLSINYTDDEKIQESLSDGVAYSIMMAREKGEQESEHVKDYYNKAVSAMVTSALVNEDIDSARSLLSKYGSKAEGVIPLLESKIDKKQREIDNRNKSERIAAYGLSVFESTGGDYNATINRILNDKSIPADERMSAIRSLAPVVAAKKTQEAKIRDSISREINSDVLMGDIPLDQWVKDNPDKWSQIDPAEQRVFMNAYGRKTGSSSKSASKKTITNPSLNGNVDAIIKNNDRAGASYFLNAYSDALSDKQKEKLVALTKTDKPFTQFELKDLPPKIKFKVNALDDDDKDIVLTLINDYLFTAQKDQGQIPDKEQIMSFADSILNDERYKDYAEQLEVGQSGYDNNSIVASSLIDDSVDDAIRIMEDNKIPFDRDTAINLVHAFRVNNNGRIPSEYDIVKMVNEAVKMASPVTIRTKDNKILLIDRLHNGEYLDTVDKAIAYYQQNPDAGKLFDSADDAKKYLADKLINRKAEETAVNPVAAVVDNQNNTAVKEAEALLKANGVSVEPISSRLVKTAKEMVTTNLNAIYKNVSTLSDKSSRFIVDQIDTIRSFLPQETQEERHINLMSEFRNSPDPQKAALILHDPESTQQEKKLADAYLLMVKNNGR